MMAIAGKTARDIIESWVHIIRTDIDQGFLYPLNEWIGEDADGNSLIDEDEATWERWKEIPPLIVFLSCQKIILRGIIIPSMK